MTKGQFQSAAQSVLHIAGTAAVALAVVNPAWGALAQGGVAATGALVAFVGAVWSFVTPPAPKAA
jgi:hypothetical protein